MEQYVGWLYRGLREAGDDARLLTSSAGSAAAGSADYVAHGSNRKVAQVALQLVNPAAVRRARSAVREFEPEIVHVNMFETHLSPSVFAAFRGVPTVLMVHNYKPICPVGSKLLPAETICTVPAGLVCWRGGCVGPAHWLRDRPRYALVAWALDRVDRVLAPSRWLARELRKHGIAAATLRPGVPLPGPAFRREPAAEPLFVFVGRLASEKGVGLLLRAFARLRASVPEARLRIVGEGPQRPELEALCARLRLGSAVTFLGRLSQADVELELARPWALVAPSLWAEPLGLVALEALVRGVPVVVSESGGFGETVRPGRDGLLFRNGDEEALARALEAIATGRAFPQRELAADAVARAKIRYDLAGHVEHLRGVLLETAHRAGSAAGGV